MSKVSAANCSDWDSHKPRNPYSGEMNDDVILFCPEHGGTTTPELCEDESHPPPPPLPPCTCPPPKVTAIEDQHGVVASGGWCAPSSTVYTLVTHHEEDCPHYVRPLMFSMPEVAVPRGGITFFATGFGS